MDIEEVNWSDELDGENFELPLDNTHVHGCHWKCKDGEAKYVLLFLHGLCSTVGFNANLLREIPNHCGSALATDHIGSGHSPGSKSHTSIDQICRETTELIKYTTSLYPNTPIFLFGHSLGGLAACKFTLMHSPEVDKLAGLILHAPWLETTGGLKQSFVLKTFLSIASFVCPRLQLNTGLDVTKSVYHDRYKETVLNSPHINKAITPVLLKSVFEAMNYIKSNTHNFPKGLPLLFMQGMLDNLVNPVNNVAWAESVQNINGNDIVSIAKFEDGPHDITKFKTRKEALEKMFGFINHIIAK